MARAPSGNGITDPVQIRALELLTPKQFGILMGHGETTVVGWIRKGWVKRYTALDTSNVLIHRSEIERFVSERWESEELKRAKVRDARRVGKRATA